MPVVIVRFISNSGLISRGIDWTCNSLWSHTETLTPDGKGWWGAHAGTGIQIRPLDYCKPRRERRYAIPVSETGFTLAWTWAYKQVGVKYNYLDILGLFIRNRRFHSPNKFICSQAVDCFFEKAGCFFLNVLEDYEYLVTPEMLHLSPILRGREVQG